MSLPYIKCPKCNERSSPHNHWTCPYCGYSESREWVLKEENKDYEDEREKRIEVREEELKKWEGEQEELCQKVINYLLPNQKVDLNFYESLPKDNWGMALYQENDINKANQAEKRFTKNDNLNEWGVKYLTTYTNEPSKISISHQTLRTKLASSPTGSAGFLPTSAHESAHISPQVNHDPLYRPWVNKGHDDVWKRVSEQFYRKVKSKFGKEVEERFKKLEEIEKMK